MARYETLEVASEVVGVSVATIYRWLRLGYVQRYKQVEHGNLRTKVDVEEVRRFHLNRPLELVE